MNIHDLLQMVVDKGASDLHILVGMKPTIRIDGDLIPVEDAPVLTPAQSEALVTPLLTAEQKQYLMVNKEIDLGYTFKNAGRFRINVYTQRDSLAAALRLIPPTIKTLDELQMPQIFHSFVQYRQGLILVTGPTGEGKSTTLAAIIEEINRVRTEHILTIEDPIEFIYTPVKSIISQREVNHDTHGWEVALRSALREDPDVVLVGEMRDYETIAAAITVAETGHLVFGTLHTATAAQTIDRIIDVFPAHQQSQIRQQLAGVLEAVVSQRLLKRKSGGRVAATEILMANSAVRNLIREQKTHQIDNVMQTSGEDGMMLMETSLLQLVQHDQVSLEEARAHSFRPDIFERLGGAAA